MREQTEEIASIEKQIAAYSNSDAEEDKKKIQELKVSLEEAKTDLEETEYDKMVSDQKAMLDELMLEYETVLMNRLDNLDALIADMTFQINANAVTIGQTITDQSNAVGYAISEEMSMIWDEEKIAAEANANGIANVITMYGDKFATNQTTTKTAIDNIYVRMQTMINAINSAAGKKVTTASTSSAAKSTPSTSSSSNNNNQNNQNQNQNKNNSSGDGTPKVGDKVKFVSGSYYYDSYGTRPLGSQNQGKYVYITNINKKGSHPYHISTGTKLGKGDLGWLKLNQISGYATGKKNFLSDEIAWTQENGAEMIIRPSDGAILTPLAKGDSVLSSMASNNLWQMANNPADFIRDTLGLDGVGVPAGSGGQTNIEQNFDQIVISLPNVKNYEQMLSEMQKDKNFQNFVMSFSIDRLAGKSKLAKGKSIR